MTFLALLTKELRLRMRRERTVWVIISYLISMGLLGWFFIDSANRTQGYPNSNGLSDTGLQLYVLLSVVQLFLIVFITPAFTATSVNGEKERQTFDLLLCSRLSPFSLMSGKLVAGLMNALLLIAASIPLFSLVFFFGGVSPLQVLNALLIFVVTALLMGTFGLFCSAIFQRPSVSTAVAYIAGVLWMVLPLIISFILFLSGSTWFQLYPNRSKLLFTWNPIIALGSTYPHSTETYPTIFRFTGILGFGIFRLLGGINPFVFGKITLPLWLVYTALTLIVTLILFLLCLWTVRPKSLERWHGSAAQQEQ